MLRLRSETCVECVNCVLLCFVLSWYKVWWTRVDNCAAGVFIIFRPTDVNASIQKVKVDSLQKLLKGDYVALALILPKPAAKFHNIPQEQLSSLEDDNPLELLLDENRAYNFYHALRSVQETEDLDDETHDDFELTKHIIRQALRYRCNKLDLCIERCGKKKKYTCTISCKEKIDNKNICNESKEPKCKRPKCGRTMPPNWKKLK